MTSGKRKRCAFVDSDILEKKQMAYSLSAFVVDIMFEFDELRPARFEHKSYSNAYIYKF